MKLLFCCESYWPHRGGVQEVMRQIAERMAARGHQVTVATSQHPLRKEGVVNGVAVRAFNAGGKMVYGLNGEIDQYREFVRTFDADAILVMAAQQWSFDALWPVLDDIKARKVFIPCGFSGLYDPDFAQYFQEMPGILKKFDHLVFNAEKYRDIDFARMHGLSNFTVLPNGISETDFEQPADANFRQKLGIPDNAYLFLTVGNPVEAKGHRQVLEAFSLLEPDERPLVFLAIADWSTNTGLAARFRRAREIVHLEGIRGLAQRLHRKLGQVATTDPTSPPQPPIRNLAKRASGQQSKRAILTDLERRDLVQAYLTADLFVFASRIEYSPLVLFEAAAAGTPFLTVPVGNADEIVRWTGGGLLCDAVKDKRGQTCVDPATLATAMARCMKDHETLRRMGAAARARWRRFFTWKVVAGYYEDILAGRTPHVRLAEFATTPEERGTSSVA